MKVLITSSLLLFFTSFLFAQTPQGIPYQAVLRNADGSVMEGSAANMIFMIHDGSATGTVVYEESHALTSNMQGLVSCVVGNGVVLQGNFANINWGSGAKFLHVMMGSTDLGTHQMLSVPYALHSKSADSVSNGIMIDSISNDGDTLFLSNGQTFVSSSGQGSGNSGSLVLPVITTNAVTGITSNSATFGGSISNANGVEIIQRGIVYSTSPHPSVYDINDSKIQVGSGTDVFDTISALGHSYAHLLTPNTTYFVKAYAFTENNIYVYGNEVVFQTLPVGEIGPGGGWVFFNKGNMYGGWQYLEVAPSDQSISVQWGCSDASNLGTSLLVGSGESNTNLIIANCQNAPAAEFCANLSLGGQIDWFLPSRDELNLIYRNLYVNGIGGLTNGYYWSSSEYFSDLAWIFDTEFGYSFDAGKPSNFKVRAVRAF